MYDKFTRPFFTLDEALIRQMKFRLKFERIIKFFRLRKPYCLIFEKNFRRLFPQIFICFHRLSLYGTKKYNSFIRLKAIKAIDFYEAMRSKFACRMHFS